MIACGLDFGTSNSAIGVLKGNAPALAPVEGLNTLIPSAVFFEDQDRYHVRFGADAISTYIEQADGRLFRALKTILGSPLIEETTALGRRKIAVASGSSRCWPARSRRNRRRQGGADAARHRPSRGLPRGHLRL